MPEIINLTHQAPWQEIRSTAQDWDAFGAVSLLKMLHHLHVIRAFEETVLELNALGLVHGPAHSSIGQEGGAVGTVLALHPGDEVNGSHRGHHQFLAKALQHVAPKGFDLTGELSD